MAVTVTTLASFDGTDGQRPLGELVTDGDGMFYGTASLNGSSGDGTVFAFSMATQQITVLHAFTGTNGDGLSPVGSLTMDASGDIFGTTSSTSPQSGAGTVFALVPSGGSYAYAGTIANLQGSSAAGIITGVRVEPDGTLFGTAVAGGANGTGAVFTVAPGSSTPVVTSFPANDSNPGSKGPYFLSAPVQYGTGIYGTTSGSASSDPGTIFKFDTTTSTLSTLATLDPATTGFAPLSGVIADAEGNLYGTTTQGGANSYGAIYEYVAATGAFKTLASFDSSTTGTQSAGNLLRDSVGDLFGTTGSGGAHGDGTVFELKAGASAITDLYDFSGSPDDGATPYGGLIVDKTGNLFGMTSAGGAANDGTIYEVQGAYVACFAPGTRIRTVRGDVNVEALAIGDRVVTASGATRPIRWLGHRRLDCRRHPRPSEVLPIRVGAHAFGPDRPARDLLVSPGHAVCVDVIGQTLILAGALVNGATIRQVEVDAVTYWHVELDSHDIILAENLPAESYLDMGNRGFFADAEVVDLAAGPDCEAARRACADDGRPSRETGPLVEARPSVARAG